MNWTPYVVECKCKCVTPPDCQLKLERLGKHSYLCHGKSVPEDEVRGQERFLPPLRDPTVCPGSHPRLARSVSADVHVFIKKGEEKKVQVEVDVPDRSEKAISPQPSA